MKPYVVCTTLLIETSPQALPLGAACIASAIKHDKKTKELFEVSLIAVSQEDDEYKKALSKNQAALFYVNKITDNENRVPDYVLFSVYVWNRTALEDAAHLLKEKFPKVKLLAGGPEVTANPSSFKNFDYTVSGAGENAMPELLFLLDKHSKNDNEVFNLPQGIFTSSIEKNISHANCRALSPELNVISSPYLDGTLDPSEYGGALWELARGCPFKCSYCYESKGEKKIQYFPMERIKKELELFNEKKIAQVFVLDPTYNANKKRAKELLELIRQKAPGMFFYFEARAEFIDRELASAFTKIPCALQFGLQSSNPEVLKYVNRTLDKKLFARNIGYLNDAGAIFGFDLIYGLPKDTLEGFRKSVDFALGLYPNNLETFCLSVLPGTDLSERADDLGLVYQKEAPYHVLKTDSFSEEDLNKAEIISHSCNVFYNQGRAVPWFFNFTKALRLRPIVIIEEFAKWYEKTVFIKTKKTLRDFDAECNSHNEIERLQIEFSNYILSKYQKKTLLKVVQDIITLNGALSRVESDCKEQIIKLSYHPDDLLSPYATDFLFFIKNAQGYNCTVRCFKNKRGQTDYKIIMR